jgi:outer membrane protein assembly factor BamB
VAGAGEREVYLRTTTSSSLGGGKNEFSFWVEAHRATDGKLLWRSGVGKHEGFWLSPLAVGSGIVVYPSEDSSLHVIDAATGAPRWTMPGNNRNVRPAIANGLVWTGDSADRLVALDARNGRRRWASQPFPPDGPGSPVLAAGTLLVGDPKTARLFAYRVGS